VTGSAELSAEDRKLVTLARATRARTGAPEGAAVRDLDGRTYAGVTVELASLSVSAIAVCVAMAVSSGARGLEAAVLLTDRDGIADRDVDVLRDFGGEEVALHLVDLRGTLRNTRDTSKE
jgi:hypothetical protein